MGKATILVLCVAMLALLPAVVLATQSRGFELSLETVPFDGLGDGEGAQRPDLQFKLFLPTEYQTDTNVRLPVIYLLHGSNGSFKTSEWDDFFPVLSELISSGKIPPMIAVAPVAGNSYWVDSDKYGSYETAIMKALIPYIDAHYRTQDERGNRFVAGFSMGGYGALRYALVYPEIFEACILLSPFVQSEEPPATSRAATGGVFANADGNFDRAIWDKKNYPAMLKAYAQQENRVRFFIYTSDDDWNHLSEKEDLPIDAWKYNMEIQAVKLYSALKREDPFNADFPQWEDVPGNPAELRIVDGGHDSSVWLRGFADGLEYIFSGM